VPPRVSPHPRRGASPPVPPGTRCAASVPLACP
jgi:hypothetical protein